MSDTVSTFAYLLRAQRRALGLTQAELAERAHVSERAISDMERGLKLPQRATMQLLADALGLSPTQVAEFESARRARVQRPIESHANRNEVPAARTSFVGRERLLEDVRRRLDPASAGCRILTLTGPGGTGKTRLAQQAATTLRDHYPDGLWFVDLAPVADTGLVAPTIAQALGVANDRLPPLESIARYLRDRQALLILDNFEQVLGAGVDIANLVAATAGLRVMITSRAPLRLLAEQVIAVPPLALPEARTPRIGDIEESESVRLFVDRARAVNAEFALTEDNASAVAEICRRLDGLPLAIELAAARSRLLEPRTMLDRLERRLQWLTDGARDAPTRQQTLRNTIAWSYDLLPSNEQAVFRTLAVFVGGISLEAASAVRLEASRGANEEDILDVIDSLAARNLSQPQPGTAGEVRVGMLETIREFGLEQLAWTGELESVRRQHAAYFLTLGEQAEAGLAGAAARTWLDRLEIEHDNLRAALEWSLSRQHGDTALRLAAALGRFWWLSGHFGEGRRWLARALAGNMEPSAARMRALHGAGWLAHFQRDSSAARTLLEESLAIAQQRDDLWWQAWVLHALGRVAYFEYDAAGARQLGEECLAIAERLGDRWLIGWALHLLGLAAFIGHDDATALAHYGRSLEIRRELGHLDGVVILAHITGMLLERSGNLEAALAHYREALDVVRSLNSRWLLSTILPHFASLAAAGQPRRAARLGGAVTLLSESAQTLPIPITEALFNQGMQLARRKLGDTAFKAAWADGRAMSLDATIAEALAVELSPSRTDTQLTAAEVEVLRRMASGYTSRQIATDLVIAVSTVDRHITHIYQKIGRRGRAAAAAFALEQGLVRPGQPLSPRA